MKRREQREIAFALIFEQAVSKEDITDIIECARECRDVEIRTFATTLAVGVQNNKIEIDEIIEKYSKGWSVERLTNVAAATLRLAVYEMMYEISIPVSVSINEAVELAKTYGSKDDAPFINGILSSVAKNEAVIEE